MATTLIRLFAPVFDQTELLGDLEERYLHRLQRDSSASARRWYWKEAFKLVGALLLLETRRTPVTFWSDLRLAFRSLLKEPMLVSIAVVTLGIGIGAPTTLFAILEGFFEPLPVTDSARIIDIALLDQKSGRNPNPTLEMVAAWRRAVSELEAMGVYSADHVAISGDGFHPERLSAAYVSAEVIPMLEGESIRGRFFEQADITLSAPPTAVISEILWSERYSRSPDTLGSQIRVDGTHYEIIGILASGFAFPRDQQLWLPLENRQSSNLSVVGRLSDGASSEVVREQLLSATLELIPRELAEIEPAIEVEEYIVAYCGREAVTGLRILTFVVSFLVLIAAVNVAALLLARGESRSREMALRLALGATRGRVVSQLLTEGLLLAAGGGIVALAITDTGISWFRAIIESRAAPYYWMRFEIDARVFAFTGLLILVATLAAGIFVPFLANVPSVLWVALEAPGATHRALTILQDAVQQIDPALPVARPQTMAEVFIRENAEERTFGILFGTFGLAALLLATAGVSGVVSLNVSRRTREIGIRRALGASTKTLLMTALRRGLQSALLGMILGVAMSFFLAPLAGEILYGWDPHAPWIFTLVPMLLLTVCLSAAFAPAVRAIRMPAVSALRTE